MLSKIGFENFNESLTTRENIKLQLISKYLDFKVGEVWNEIEQELELQSIRPVSPDLYCLSSIKRTVASKLDYLVEKQLGLVQKSEANRTEQEHEFFDNWINEFIKVPVAVNAPKIHTWKQSLLSKPE
jgi:hypothetical protein